MKITPPIRGRDSHGSGAFGASRVSARIHKGVDLACYAGSLIYSLTPGKVTKLGYPHDPSNIKKGHLRYVQVTHEGKDYRYFYVSPSVRVGDEVRKDDVIGMAQGLLKIYPGITDHIHFEIKLQDGSFEDPTPLIKGA